MRQIKQTQVFMDHLVATCEDSSMWRMGVDFKEWKKIPSVPFTEDLTGDDYNESIKEMHVDEHLMFFLTQDEFEELIKNKKILDTSHSYVNLIGDVHITPEILNGTSIATGVKAYCNEHRYLVLVEEGK